MNGSSDMTLTVRLLTADDAPAYRQLRLEALRLSPTAFGSSYEDELARDPAVTLERISPTENSRVFGAFRADRLVGTVGLRRQTGRKDRHKAFVWGVYVTPAERGLGIARRLMSVVIEQARGLAGLARVNIAVNAANEPARSLYESLGFEAYGLEPDALRVDGASIEELWMTLALDRARS